MNFLIKKAMLFMAFLCIFTIAEAADNNLLTLPPTCATGPLTLIIQYDNNPEEVHWMIRNSLSYGVIAGGATVQTPNLLDTIQVPYLAPGDYLLTFTDMGGNGLCCQAGNGFYTLLDGQTVLATGSIYTYSNPTPFCVGTTNNTQFDMTIPSTPGLSMSNVTATSVDLTVTPSTDNVGVVGYVILDDDLTSYDLYGPTPGTVNISGLTFGTTYSFKVQAVDMAGNFSDASNIVTITTGYRCASGPLTLDFQFDAYPGETAWDIKDPANNIVASSGNFTYFNEAPNSTLSENIATLPDGDYILVVYDVGGNGMCCQDGNGSYTLSDTQGALISGSAFGYSDVTEFCVGTYNGGGLDTIPPTNPIVTLSNPTAHTIDIAITPSTDNVGVTSYGVFQNGAYYGDLIPPNPLSGTIMGLPSDSTFTYYAVARDAAGNYSGNSNVASATTLSLQTTLHEG